MSNDTAPTPPFDYVAAISREGGRMLRAATGNLSTPVPRYAGWTIADLVVHTASVYRRTTTLVTERLTEPVLRDYPDDDRPDDTLEWFASALDKMTAALADADPDTPVWGFGPPPTVQFWLRRMTVETVVHRWDTLAALGTPEPLGPDLASEAIQELEVMWLPALQHDVPADDGSGGNAIGFHATDIGCHWVATPGEIGFTLTGPGTGVPDAGVTVAGTASDLYLWLTSRLDVASLDATGNTGLLALFDQSLGGMSDATR